MKSEGIPTLGSQSIGNDGSGPNPPFGRLGHPIALSGAHAVPYSGNGTAGKVFCTQRRLVAMDSIGLNPLVTTSCQCV